VATVDPIGRRMMTVFYRVQVREEGRDGRVEELGKSC
jgi:hypothetical protein